MSGATPAPLPASARRGRRGVAALAALAAVVVHLALATSMLLARPDFSWHRFRGYFPFDQESYLAIVVDGARGDSSFTEPFTGTGTDYYPHAYYLLLGFVAHVTRASPVLVWQVGGLVAQGLLVAVLAGTTVRLTGRAWTGLLAPLPFVVGTMSTLGGHGWYTVMHQHAVLWGAYAVLFTLNGESVALCLGAMALVALVLVGERRVGPRLRLPLALLACLVLGALAAVQTYSFLVAVYLAAYVAAALALLRLRPLLAAVGGGVSVALLVLLPVVGPAVAGSAGPLTALAGGLAPAVPGLVALVAWQRWRALACGLAAVVGAAPQVLWTVHGVSSGDPFLVYRQSSSSTEHLGVGTGPAFLAAACPLAALALLLAAGIVRRRPLWIAVPAGAVPAWAVVAANDRWGADQEPYRLWIDGFALVAVASFPLVVQAAAQVCSAASGRAARVVWIAATVVLVGAVAASLGDYRGFWRYGRHDIDMIDFQTSQAGAVAALVGPDSRLVSRRALVLPDPCLDPFTVKVRRQLPVAFYNYGMAWPSHERAWGRLEYGRRAGSLDVADARAAGVTVVLTDSRCSDDWPTAYRDDLQLIGSRAYAVHGGGRARVQAWRLSPGR